MPRQEEDDRGESSGLTVFEARLTNLVALLLVQERKQPEQIALLSRAGYRNAEIASLIGTTPHTVSVQLSAMKHARRQARRTSA